MAFSLLRRFSGFLPHLLSHLLSMWICLLSEGLSTLGMQRSAAGLVRSCLRWFPNEDLLPLQLVTLQERSGHVDEAIGGLTELIERGSEPAHYHFELAGLYERQRQYDLALAHFETSLVLGTRFGPEFRDFLRQKIENMKRKRSG
jgi:tetratricopeptide (TPR) repeat protein